jgi:broad specificity phosphatase PhoE
VARPAAATLRLHFARHGETVASTEGRFCGVTECALTADGRLMGELLAERCAAGGEWRAVVSSPLARCLETARPAAERLGLAIDIEPGLREIDHGAWEDRPAADVAATDTAAFAAWREHPGLRGAPGGESGYAVAARAVPVVEALRDARSDGDVLVVAHKATIRIVVCVLLGIDVDRYRDRVACPVGSVTTFAFTAGDDPLLLALGDVSHLPARLRSAGDGT